MPDAQVTMDRAFDLPGTPVDVWPWLVQLGKNRAGRYLPRAVGSRRGGLRISWTIALRPQADGCRAHLRFRIAGVRRVWLVRTVGEAADLLTVAGLAAGLRERVP